jgi:5-methylcytosine-specific restriction endonuclease McrA
MQKHIRIYFKHYGYGVDDVIKCEECGKRAVDIHHRKPRSHCSKEEVNKIGNLQALCRECHNRKHNK